MSINTLVPFIVVTGEEALTPEMTDTNKSIYRFAFSGWA